MCDKAAKITPNETVPADQRSQDIITQISVTRATATYTEGYCCSNFSLIAEAISCSVVKLAIASCKYQVKEK